MKKIAYIILAANGDELKKCTITLILAIVYVILGIAGVSD